MFKPHGIFVQTPSYLRAAFDFTRTNIPIDSRITFTRASSATYFDSTGTLQTAGSGVARANAFQDHNPSTLAPLGFLIEEQRTNIFTYSEELDNAAWTKAGASITANAATAPTGVATMDKLVEDSSTGQHRFFATRSGTTNSSAYTVSFFAKQAERTRIYVGLAESPTFVRQGNAVFDLAAGTVVFASAGSGGASGGLATITQCTNGIYRCTYTLTLGGANTSIFCDVNLVSTGTTISYTGDGTSGAFVWGMQLELGAFATSPILTTGAAATRLADVASVTGTAFSSWFNPIEGTIVSRQIRPATAIADGNIWQIDNNTSAERYSAGTGASGSVLNPFVVDGGVTQATLTQGASSALGSKSLAFAYKLNDFAAVTSGAVAVTDNSGTLPTVDQMWIGRNQTAAHWNGHIQSIAYYNRRLPNATLQALTV